MHRRDSRILRLIALFRWTKALLLIAAGFAMLHLVNPDAGARLESWLAALPLAYEQKFARHAIAFVARLEDPRRAALYASAAFAYAALFIIEGTGRWMQKRWAEYLTLIATASFLPFEVYEVVEKFIALSLIVLVSNVTILVYLVWRVRHHE